MARYLRILILIIALFFILTGCSIIQDEEYPKAANGVLDLSNWDFHNKGEVNLDGEWEFYWQELLEPADFKTKQLPTPYYMDIPRPWEGYMVAEEKLLGDGYATFRLNLHIPDESKIKVYGLEVLPMVTAYKLWVDGELAATNGKVGKNERDTTPQYLAKVVPIQSRGTQMELVLQVVNFQHPKGGFWDSLSFGPFQQIQNKFLLGSWVKLFLIGALTIIGIYYLLIYLYRRQERYTLFFGLFCLIVAIRNSLVHEFILTIIFNDLDWNLMKKMQYLSYYLILPVAFTYYYYLYPDDFNKKIIRAVQLISLTFSAIIIVTPLKIYYYTENIYNVIVLISLAYWSYSLIRAVHYKRKGILVVIFGSVFLLAAACIDIIGKNISIKDSNLLFPLALFVYTFSQTIIMSMRFSRAFLTVEKLSKDLLNQRKKFEEKNLILNKALRQTAAAEVNFLQAQIKPHFLYNSLNTIMGLCLNNPKKAYELIGELSSFLQGKFQLQGTDDFIPLDKEIELIESYLNIEKARFGERIKIIYDMDPGVNPQIPPLILQPIVENAVKHGIYPRKEGGTIQIMVKKEDQNAVLTIKDNGMGMPIKKIDRFLTGQEKRSSGLQNVNKRLEAYFGCGLQIMSEIGKGTTVSIKIPWGKKEKV